MPAVIDVDSGLYQAASRVFGQTLAPGVRTAANQLTSALSLSHGMAGSDEAGTSWASSYDTAARQALAVMLSLEPASFTIAGLLEQTGFNHDAAEAASDPAGRAPQPPDRTAYDMQMTTPTGGVGCEPGTVPTAAGSTSGGPPGWGTVQHLVGYLWPNGDTGRLRASAGAWTTAAETLESLAACVPEAVASIEAQRSPEVDDAVAVVSSMQQNLTGTADACRTLSQSCHQLADHIDSAHSELISELESFVEWTAAIEAGGALFSVFTLGGSEVAAQGAEALRMSQTAARLAEICRTLVEAAKTVGATIEQVTTRVASVGAKLEKILGARLSTVVTSAVEKFPQLGRIAGTAEKGFVADAKYQQYLERMAAKGRTPKTREQWQKYTDTVARNKRIGDEFREDVAKKLGIRPGEAGWEREATLKTSAGSRRYDLAHLKQRTGIEVKSGTSPHGETMTQLTKDEAAVETGWHVKWVLKQELSPKLMERLNELHKLYGDRFTWELAK